MEGRSSGPAPENTGRNTEYAARTEAGSILTPDLIALAQGGVCVIFGARGADGRPVVGVGVGARIDAGGKVRTFLNSQPNRKLLDAILAGSSIAATFTRALDHASFQAKAGSASIADVDPDDFAEIGRQCAISGQELHDLGLPPQVAAAYSSYSPVGMVAIEFVPEQAFVQTPGPGAGRPVGK